MALLGTIRNNMWFVFILIALATVAFIYMDATGPGGGNFGGANANTPLGTIAGEKIKQQEFNLSNNYLFSGIQNANAKRDILWNYYVDRGILNSEAEKLGLGIGYDEIMDLQFGSNLSPVIRNNFTQNGRLQVEQLQQFKNAFESGEGLDPEVALFWREQEQQVKKEQLQVKINSLAQKAIYTPNWMAQNAVAEENGTANLAVVRIPFDAIDDAGIEVSDNDILSYMTERKDQYELKEQVREGEYVAYVLKASAQDSATLLARINENMERFKTTPNDSTFCLANNGFFSSGYAKPYQVDEFYADKISDFEVGGVYGPYILGNSYQAVKLVNKLNSVPDSVKTRHILKQVVPGNDTQLEEANDLIDSLLSVLTRNKSKFAELAAEFSDDPSNKDEGGDLGYLTQGTIIKGINDVAFITGEEGGLYKVKTAVGVHLVYVEDQIYNDRSPGYQLAYINTPILPGEETQEDAYNVLLNLVNSYPYMNELKAEAEKDPALTIGKTGNLDINGYQIADLGSDDEARNIVKYLFNPSSEKGGVSQKIYEFSNQISYTPEKYVIVGLNTITEPGLPSAASVRGQVEFAIRNKMKAEKVLTSISGSLAAIAGQYNTTVDTLRDLSMLNNSIATYGNEPDVLGKAFGQAVGTTSSPIIGNSGIYLVNTLSKTPAETQQIAGISFIKNTISGNKKSALQFSLLEALKEHYDIEDNRSAIY